jgi:pimeloyl-ACP methyl ester carboxylesterase
MLRYVILPGLDGDAALRAPLVDALGPQAAVIGYPRETWLYADMMDVVAPLLPKDDFVLIAESYGGPLALKLAGMRPPGLKGVIFVVTFAKPPRWVPGFLLDWLDKTSKPSRRMIDLVLRLSGGAAGSAAIKAMVEVALALPINTTHGRLREVLTTDISDQLGTLGVPMAYIAAGSDRLIPKRHARQFAKAGAHLIEVPGSHFVLEEAPLVGANAIRTALRDMGLAP